MKRLVLVAVGGVAVGLLASVLWMWTQSSVVNSSAPDGTPAVGGQTPRQPEVTAPPAKAGPDLSVDAGASEATTENAGGIISGRILIEETGKPIAGALVMAVGLRSVSATEREAVSGMDGTYGLTELPEGSFNVHCYLPDDVAPEVYERSTRGVDVVVPRGESVEGIDIRFALGLSLWGRVVDARNNAPVAKAPLEVCWSPRSSFIRRHIVTGPDGRYSVSGLGAGHGCSIRVEAAGYIPTSVYFRIPSDTQDGSSLPDVVISRGGLVQGQLVDTWDRPVPGVGICLRPKGLQDQWVKGQRVPEPVTCDAEGRFEFSLGVPPGIYVFEAGTRGWGALNEDEMGRGHLLQARNPPLIVEAGKTYADLRIVVTALEGTCVEGVVIDEEGTPLEAARIDAASDRGSDAITWSDSTGFFFLEGLDGDTCDLTLRARGFARGRLSSVPIGSRDVRAVMRRHGSILCFVREQETQRPIDEASIRYLAFAEDGKVDRQGRERRIAAGQYLVEELQPGPGRLEVSAPGYPVQEADAVVDSGGVTRMELELATGGALEGMATFPAIPYPRYYGVTTFQAGMTGSTGGADVGRDGTYRIASLLPGVHWVCFSQQYSGHMSVPSRFTTFSVNIEAGETTRLDIDLGGPGLILGSVAPPRGCRRVSLRVQEAGGAEAVAFGEDLIYPDQTVAELRVFGDEWSFRVSDLPEGDYELTAVYEVGERLTDRGVRQISQTVTVNGAAPVEVHLVCE